MVEHARGFSHTRWLEGALAEVLPTALDPLHGSGERRVNSLGYLGRVCRTHAQRDGIVAVPPPPPRAHRQNGGRRTTP